MVKRVKIDEDAWLRNIIFLLREADGGLSMSKLYEMTNITECTQTESHLYEHPSLRYRNGIITFRPFTHISSKSELLALFERVYPKAIRRIHLHGLYRHIEADIDDLLLRQDISRIDAKFDSLIWARVPVQPLTDELGRLYKTLIQNQN